MLRGSSLEPLSGVFQLVFLECLNGVFEWSVKCGVEYSVNEEDCGLEYSVK